MLPHCRALIERYPPDAVLWSGNTQASFSSRVLNEYLVAAEYSGDDSQSLNRFWILGEGATLRVLTTGPRGAVLLIECENFRTLLPIGMSFEALDELRKARALDL